LKQHYEDKTRLCAFDAALTKLCHRHRYEVNNNLIDKIEDAGLKISGRSIDNSLVEMVEISDHPWFVALMLFLTYWYLY
jgi:CTP synthase